MKKLRPVRFNWKESGNEAIGLIAEEVNELIPESVPKDEEGKPKSVNLNGVVSVLLKEIQTQRKIIDKLVEEVELLKKA